MAACFSTTWHQLLHWLAGFINRSGPTYYIHISSPLILCFSELRQSRLVLGTSFSPSAQGASIGFLFKSRLLRAAGLTAPSVNVTMVTVGGCHGYRGSGRLEITIVRMEWVAFFHNPILWNTIFLYNRIIFRSPSSPSSPEKNAMIQVHLDHLVPP